MRETVRRRDTRGARAALIAALWVTGGGGVAHGATVCHEIPAPALAGSRLSEPTRQPLCVVTPPGYASGAARYPVVYYLPGFTTEVREYFDGSYDGWDLGRELDRRPRSGALPESIVVVVNGRSRLGGSFYVDSRITGNWESHLLRDVLPFVDASYRTLPSRGGRALVGDSMGGSGALQLGMRHPERFSVVYALSPGLFAADGLARSGLLAPHRAAATAWWRERLRVAPRSRSLPDLADTLLSSHQRFAYQLVFTWAYAAAYAPDLAERWLPGLDAEAAQAPSASARAAAFEAGFGDLERRVERFRDALRSLSGLGIDCGRNDRATWIPAGCEHLSRLLDEAGVEHSLEMHDGGHVDRLAERFAEHAMPYVLSRLEPPGLAP